MKKYGLLGEKLGHSFSPRIHKLLCGYPYDLYEIERDRLGEFLSTTELMGMNVTIPYKKDVMPYCSYIDPSAKRIGSVNTLVKHEDGWHAYNTDYFGFRYMVEKSGISPKGKKVVVLGSGGASLAVRTALEDMGAAEIVIVSRSGENNYDNLHLHVDTEIVVNSTPVGMYPKNGAAPVSLDSFPNCKAVLDLVYNPLRTELIMDAEKRGIAAVGGLSMLVAQAHKSAELFFGESIPVERMEEVYDTLVSDVSNIVVIGMPGSGKSSVGKALAAAMDREFYDADDEITKFAGETPEKIINTRGEEAFRKIETTVLAELGKKSGCVISTGGGIVTRERNYPLLHQNGTIVWIKRELGELAVDGRPISLSMPVEELYRKREKLYNSFSDFDVQNAGTVDDAVKEILEGKR